MNTIDVLNQLLALHGSSLPMYLTSAPPHRQKGDEKAWEAIRHIVEDQQLMVDKIAAYIESAGGTPDMGEFSMDFTGMHDLSVDYILQSVLSSQQVDVEAIEEISGQLPQGSQGKTLAQEALGAAKAHVQSLEEWLSAAATTSS